jgi:hypothetical protein
VSNSRTQKGNDIEMVFRLDVFRETSFLVTCSTSHINFLSFQKELYQDLCNVLPGWV